MKRYIILFSVIVFFISACSHSKDKPVSMDKPEGLIPQEKMIQILTDIHIAEALIVQVQGRGQDVNSATGHYYTTILKKHQITRTNFSQSIEYYSYNTKQISEIYTEVITNLSKIQAEETRK
jgi:hypothetical protein